MATNPKPNPNDKDVLYVDIDDDITTIIDKLRTSEAKVVALVLPKRVSECREHEIAQTKC